jgi:hypothetical protein
VKIIVPKGTIVKFSSKPCEKWFEKKQLRLDEQGFLTTPFLKQHKMKVKLAHEEDCGCGSDHPFEAVSVYDERCLNRMLVSTAWGIEFEPHGVIPEETIVIHAMNEEDRNKEWFARMGYDLIYELHFKKKSFFGRAWLLTVFGAQLVWRYLFKNRG